MPHRRTVLAANTKWHTGDLAPHTTPVALSVVSTPMPMPFPNVRQVRQQGLDTNTVLASAALLLVPPIIPHPSPVACHLSHRR